MTQTSDEHLDQDTSGTETLPLFTATSSGTTRYRPLRLHAEGGLGKIFVAQDDELHREVALKEIRPRLADNAESRARFIREAEITGGLEHPGIVPVYGLGQYADGRPFYVMRFIQGNTLQDAIERFHQRKLGGGTTQVDDSLPPPRAVAAKRTRSERNLEIRKFLQRLIDVCEALEYAHNRGVLHRDIKPGNIMLGKYGETLVVDWGLARAGADVEDEGSLRDHVLVPSSGGGATQFGSAVGTPSFMSPEQAAGRLDQLSPACDIYSLGATLYAVLTGRVPFEGRDVGKILQHVQAGDFPPPRAINRQIAPALEAVCLKAMSKRPADRYASARELAVDIEHWLADEPVAAYQESSIQRLGRWARRNKSLVRAAAVALLLVSGISTLAAVWINVERLNVDLQRQHADRERQRAELLVIEKDNLAQAEREQRHAALRLAGDNQRIAEEKTTLAEQMTTLAEQNAKLADDQRQEADKSRRLAEFLVGTFQAADPIGMGGATFFIPKANSEQLTARQILDRGAERVKNDQQLDQFPLAKAAIMNEIGDVYRQLGLFPQAEPLLLQALDVRRRLLPAEHPDIAASCHNLGWYYHERGDFLKAEPLYQEALAIRQKMTDPDGQRLAATTLHNLAWMLANAREPAQAEKLFRQALDLRRKLHGNLHREVVFSKMGIAFALIEQNRMVEAMPLVLSAKSELFKLEGNQHLTDAGTAFALGVIYREILGLKASETQLRQAHQSVVAALGPDNIYVGLIQFELGTTIEQQRRLDEAETHYQDALRIARDQVQMQHPRISLLVQRYARLMARRGRIDEATALWQEFVAAQRSRFGDDNLFLADALYPYGVFLKDRKNHPAAIEVLEEAIQIYERHPPTSYSYHHDALQQAGLCYLDEGLDPAKAESYFRKGLEALATSSWRSDADELIMRINLAWALIEQQKFTQAEEILLLARQEAEKLTGEDRGECLEYSLQNMARLYLARREPAKAAQFIAARKGYKKKSASDIYSIAGQFAQCAQLIGIEEESLSEEQKAERAKYSDLALARLKDSFAAGFKNVSFLRQDETFSALREHPEFQKLVAEADPQAP